MSAGPVAGALQALERHRQRALLLVARALVHSRRRTWWRSSAMLARCEK
jgi:hypothetical protein